MSEKVDGLVDWLHLMFGREFISILLRNLSSIQPALRNDWLHLIDWLDGLIFVASFAPAHKNLWKHLVKFRCAIGIHPE